MLALKEEARKERQFGLVRDSVAEENSTLEERIAAREREMKIPPPQRNPFKIIPGLEAQLKKEQEELDKKDGNYKAQEKKEEEVEPMTKDQYLAIYDEMFKICDQSDADVMLMKLK